MRHALPRPVILLLPVLGCTEPAGEDPGGTTGQAQTGSEASTTDLSETAAEPGSTSSLETSTSTGTETETTSSPPESACGDGIVEAEEACDDGNDVDADGCNRDCTASGELLWRFDFPFGVSALQIDVDEVDQLHVLGLDGGVDIAHFVFSPDGELMMQEVLDVPAPTIPARRWAWDRRDMIGFRLGQAGAVVFAFRDVFNGAEGAIDATMSLHSTDPPWSTDWGVDQGIRFDFDVTGDGRIFGMRGAFLSLSPEGTVLATGPHADGRFVAAGASGAAFAGREVTYYDADGSVAWSVDWPSGVLAGAVAVDHFPGGDVLVFGSAGEDILDEQQLRLARYAPSGEEVSTWLWPDAPDEHVYPALRTLVVSPQEHVSFAAGDEDGLFLWKMNEDYTTRWKVEVADGVAPEQLVSDSKGALFFHERRSVGKFAP